MLMQRDKNILKFLEKYKAITIQQSYRIFFNNAKFGNDRSRKRLKELETMGVLKSYINKLTREKVYYLEDKVSAHDLYINDFYSMLVFNGCKDIEYIKEPKYLKGLIRPDAFFKFTLDDNLHFILLEVDLTHFTGANKFQMYEKLYKENILQKECYGTFPLVVIIGVNDIKYESNNFFVEYLDFSLKGLEKRILGLER
ncbi:MAG: hypothetical protein AB2417_02455 [Clostridiaceae bacterium]